MQWVSVKADCYCRITIIYVRPPHTRHRHRLCNHRNRDHCHKHNLSMDSTEPIGLSRGIMILIAAQKFESKMASLHCAGKNSSSKWLLGILPSWKLKQQLSRDWASWGYFSDCLTLRWWEWWWLKETSMYRVLLCQMECSDKSNVNHQDPPKPTRNHNEPPGTTKTHQPKTTKNQQKLQRTTRSHSACPVGGVGWDQQQTKIICFNFLFLAMSSLTRLIDL